MVGSAKVEEPGRVQAAQNECGDDGVDATDPHRPGLRERAAAQLPRVVNTGDPGDDEVRYERSAASALRLITSVLLGLAVLGLEGLLPQASLGLENDLQHHAGTWAGKLGELANAIATTWSVTLVVVTIVIGVVARRPRAVFSSCLAAMLAAGLVVVVSSTSGLTPDHVTSQEWQLAVIAAAMAMAATSFTLFAMPIARWSVAVITLFTLLGVLSGDVSIASRLVVVLVGQAVGSIVALALGVPSRRIGRRELAEALDRSRLVVDDLDELDGTDARGSVPWVATSATGRRVFVKVQAVDELRAAQLFRIWHALRLKDPADTATPRSIRQHSEHEAFVAQCARAAGALTPAILAIGDIGEGRGIYTAFETIDGETLTEVGDLSDAALRAAWSQIQILHRAGIAHHDLRASNLMSVGDEVWVIDFGAAEVDASSEALERDLAEFLSSTASLVGPERAVASAVAVLGADAVAECIPWLQPLAATAATRASLSKTDFEDLRERVRAAAGTSAPELPQLQRITWKGIAVFVAFGVAVWTLLPQLTSGIDWSAAFEGDTRWAALALLASALTYVGATMSLAGSVHQGVPFGTTFLAQLASSFTNRVTPAKVGGIALNLRFLVKQGIDRATAATGVAVSTAMGTVVHVAITLVMVVWAGNVGLPGISLPSGGVLLLIGAVSAALVALVAAVPPARAWWRTSALPSLRRSWSSCVDVMRSPRHLVEVAGGSALVTLANLVAFVVSLRAFGVDESFATLAVVYLAGAAVASAAPTPGGLGATEAALVAGLAVVGVSEDQAIPGVLLFRLATFWVPILPGWLSMLYLQHRGDL